MSLALDGRCYDCKAAFGHTRPDGTEVLDSSDGDGRCSRCAPCRQECACDSEEIHEAAREESLRSFLRDPGPAPAGWEPDRVARVRATIEAERIRLGVGK